MEAPLYITLLIAIALGILAAWISQFTAARKGLEANAKAKTLRKNVDEIQNRNKIRRENLIKCQEKLDKYSMMEIENTKGQYNDRALKETIQEEKRRLTELKKAIGETENIIVENRKVLAEVEIKRALNPLWLFITSGFAGGITALIFAFLWYIGLEDKLSLDGKSFDFFTKVPLTASLFMQSIAFGAGWPIVWEKIFSVNRLESVADNAANKFQISIKEAEKEEV